MEKENKVEEKEKEKANSRRKHVSLNTVLWGFVMLCLGGLLGFFVGTKCGINTGRSVAMQYLEYISAQAETVDTSVLSSTPAAAYGEEDAPVQVKFFSDLQCSSCVAMFEESILKMTEKSNKYRVEIYDFPSSEHKLSKIASKYARCAAAQDVDYVVFMKKLFADYAEWSSMLKESNVSEYMLQTAIVLGADEDEMNLCVIGDTATAEIEANIEDGLALGIKGTPAYTVGEKLYQGYVSPATLAKIIEDSLKSQAAAE